MIGEWLSTDPIYGEGRYVIVSKAGQLLLEIRFLEGGMVEEPLVERESSAGRRFNYADTGEEWFVINSEGNLEFWDHFGLFHTMKRLR